MANIYLLLGSNLEDRLKNITIARHLISERIGTPVQESDIYETEAWGMGDQNPFLNQALHLSSDLSPHQILKITKCLEIEIGRYETVKWGPRVIDIDILFYDDLVIESEALCIPHREIENRRFTLIPLLDIAANLVHPKKQLSIKKLVSQCNDKLQVTKFVTAGMEGNIRNEENLQTTLHP